MGNVNLLPIEPKGNKSLDEYLRYVAESLAMLQDELQNILEGRISAQNIRAESIEAKNLKAGAVTAEKIDVNELSAISANLGTITAGSITTSAQINVGTDVTIGNILNMGLTDYTGSKKIVWSSATGTKAEIEVITGDMSIRTGGFITLTIGSSMGLVINQQVIAPTIKATGSMTLSNQPVATETYVNNGLAGKANAFTGYTGSVVTGSSTLNFSNGILVSVS